MVFMKAIRFIWMHMAQCNLKIKAEDPTSTLSWKHDSSAPCALEATLDGHFFILFSCLGLGT